MRRAGACECVVDLGIDSLALAEQERRGQRLDAWVKALDELRAGPGAEVPQPAVERSLPPLEIAYQPRRALNRQSQFDSLSLKERTVLEFAGVEWSGAPGEVPDGPNLPPAADPAQIPRDDHDRPAGGRVPALPVADLRHVHHEPGPRRRRVARFRAEVEAERPSIDPAHS